MSNIASSGILINGLIWSTSNLDVSTFRNGDPIPESKTDQEWFEAGVTEQPTWGWASNDPEGRKKYGKLYNHYAVADPRGLAPEGWRIPSYDEIAALLVVGQLTDEINLPMAGFRAGDGYHFVLGSYGHYWSSSGSVRSASYLGFGKRFADMYFYSRGFGKSVRCLVDHSTPSKSGSGREASVNVNLIDDDDLPY